MSNIVPLETRFWTKVQKTRTCWLWTGSTQKGYGSLYPFGKQQPKMGAHRVAWLLTRGQRLPSDVYLCHTCNNKLCVNPAHLYEGDALTNIQDAYRCGNGQTGARHWTNRMPERNAEVFVGENHWNARLTWKQVAQIKQLRTTGMTLKALGKRFGISHQMVHRICSEKAWHGCST